MHLAYEITLGPLWIHFLIAYGLHWDLVWIHFRTACDYIYLACITFVLHLVSCVTLEESIANHMFS